MEKIIIGSNAMLLAFIFTRWKLFEYIAWILWITYLIVYIIKEKKINIVTVLYTFTTIILTLLFVRDICLT